MASETILIIDDNADVRALLGERVLPGYGYRVLLAPDGQEGLWQIRSHNPDLILLDLRLPDMTGIDLLHILSAEGYDIPVILITAYGSELIAAQALRLGVHDYIIKPFTLDEIVASIERALTKQRLRRERNALNERLQTFNEAIRILADIGSEVIPQDDTDLQLCRLLEAAVAATWASSGRLWIHQMTSGDLALQVAQDRSDQRAYLIQGGTPPPQVQQALALTTFQQWEQAHAGAQPKICLATPILLRDWPAAILELCFPQEEALPHDSRLLILRLAANWIGMVLEWARLRRRIDDLRRRFEGYSALDHDALLILDEEERIITVTPAIESLTGQRPADVVGQNFRQWAREIEFPEGPRVEWHLKPPSAQRIRERYTLTFRGPQEERRQAEVRVLLQQEPESMRCYLLFHDTTLVEQIEKESRALRRRIGQALQAQRGFMLIDLQGTVLSVDRFAAEMLRRPQEEIIGQPLWEAFAEAAGQHALPEEIARTYREGTGRAEIHRAEGKETLSIALTLLQDAQETPQAILALVGPAQPAETGATTEEKSDAGDLLGSPGVDPNSRP